MNGLSYPERLQVLGLETLQDRRRKTDLILAFQILDDKDQDIIDHKVFWTVNEQQTVTRSSKRRDIIIEKTKRNSRLHSFTLRAPKDWNKLPDDIQNSRNLNEFKTKLQGLSF